MRDFEQSTKEKFVQSRDRDTGEPVWQVTVMDGDPGCKPAQKTVTIKILATEEPQVPPLSPDMPIVPITLDSLMVTPYVHQGTGRLAYSWRARGILPARAKTGTSATHAGGAA
ncbi:MULTISPECIES: plasmid replication, integration and excision activator [unclassified Nonomuraea]|uniref:plasmid replication, integration and excision activator n=1 Tax=unclassified Nonomuraea TaxID=2593643 RepID=UPI0033F6939E